MGYGGGSFGWPASDPVERYTEREAARERAEISQASRAKFAEAIPHGTGHRISLPTAAELAMSERSFRASTRLEVEQAAEQWEEATA